jgi:hypothetical protein
MADAQNFFGWSAGASATLIGLLFVAIQVSFGRFDYDPSDRRHAMAQSTFGVFSVIFINSLTFLYPGIGAVGVSYLLAFSSAFGIFRAIRTWLPVWSGMLQERRLERAWQTAWLLVGPLACYGTMAVFAYRQIASPDVSIVLNGIPGVFIALFGVAIRNAWKLLSEPAGANPGSG